MHFVPFDWTNKFDTLLVKSLITNENDLRFGLKKKMWIDFLFIYNLSWNFKISQKQTLFYTNIYALVQL